MKRVIVYSIDEYVRLFKAGRYIDDIIITFDKRGELFDYSNVETNDPDIRFIHAWCLEYGIGTTKNVDMAFMIYQALSLKGYAPSEFRLALSELDKGNKEEYIAYLKKAADHGYPPAQCQLAVNYYRGAGVEQDYALSAFWYELAAEQGQSDAQFNLAVLYIKGLGVGIDHAKASKWFLRAAELGDETAQYNIALNYDKGDGVERDPVKAFHWYQKAAEQDYGLAQFNLALCYFHGDGTKQDYGLAVRWYEKAVEEGVIPALYNLGVCYYKGLGVKQGYPEAAFWYTKAAEKGNARAQYALGVCYDNGEGVKHDPEQAFAWYRKAAEAGHPGAQYNLAFCYREGEGTAKDLYKAFEWFTKSAIQGDKQAQYNLSICYENGDGTDMDPLQAYEWCSRSAEQGYRLAEYNLAQYYRTGSGVEPDLAKAFEWYGKAALQGLAQAEYNLGLCYKDGLGTQKDVGKAIVWLQKAVDQGLSEARDVLNELKDEQKEAVQERHLHLGARKDVFISWNHLDKAVKDLLASSLEEKGYLTIWESDGDGQGLVEDSVREAILEARSYIVLLSHNSIKSDWVRKEVKLIFGKYEDLCYSLEDTLKLIKPVFLDDVGDLIKNIPELQALSGAAAVFGVSKDSIKDIVNSTRNAVYSSLALEYRKRLQKRFSSFDTTIASSVTSELSESGIVSASLDMAKGYVDRTLHDVNGARDLRIEDILDSRTNTLIVGEGGSGKSLFLKRACHDFFTLDRFILYLPSREMKGLLIDGDETFVSIIKKVGFDSYFRDDITVSGDYFASLVRKNKTILLIDALDEIDLQALRGLKDKFVSFYKEYPDVQVVATSRDKGGLNLFPGLDINVVLVKPFMDEDIRTLFNNSLAKFKSVRQEGGDYDMSVDDTPSLESFMERVANIADDIRGNPLFVSNLIFIYLACRRIPVKGYEIIDSAAILLIDDIEKDRDVSFRYGNLIKGKKLYDLLGYVSLIRANGDNSPLGELFQEYFKSKYPDDDYETEAEEVLKYLRQRSIIVGERVYHDLFASYFVAKRIYDSILDTARDPDTMRKAIIYKNGGVARLSAHIDNGLAKEGSPWPDIASDFIMKLDYEESRIDANRAIDQLDKAFDEVLRVALGQRKFSKDSIAIIERLCKKEALYFNSFILGYIRS